MLPDAGAERHANPDLAAALRHLIRQHTVDPIAARNNATRGKPGGQQHRRPPIHQRRSNRSSIVRTP